MTTLTVGELWWEETCLLSRSMELLARIMDAYAQERELRLAAQTHTSAYIQCWAIIETLTQDHADVYERFMQIHHELEIRGIITK